MAEERLRFLIYLKQHTEASGTAAAESIRRFAELLAACHEMDFDIGISNDFWTANITDELTFAELFSAPPSWLDRETLTLLRTALNRSVSWESHWSGASSDAFEVACERIRSGVSTACLPWGTNRDPAGDHCCRLTHADDLVVRMIESPSEIKCLFRDRVECENLREDEFFANWKHAFPKVAIASPRAISFGRFSTRYRDVRASVVKHVSALEDRFFGIYQEKKGIIGDVCLRFNAECGIDASPESVKTRRDAKAMAERDVLVRAYSLGGSEKVIEPTTVRCEWHTKIHPVVDRIHFNFDKLGSGQIFVGIFCAHLRLPG